MGSSAFERDAVQGIGTEAYAVAGREGSGIAAPGLNKAEASVLQLESDLLPRSEINAYW